MAGEDGPPAAPISFAAAAQKENNASAPLRVVQLDGQAVLKIAKHCTECAPALVTGQLLGLDVGQTLEVTDCFPFPSRVSDDGEEGGDGASYQIDMMKCLREVNVDNNTVGWYQATVVGAFQTVELIETFISYQETIKRCVCIVFDPKRPGMLAFRAVRLKDTFIEVYKKQALSAEKLRAAEVSWKDVFEEIPIHVHNLPLARALMAELEAGPAASAGSSSSSACTALDTSNLNLSFAPYLAKNLEMLNDIMDDLAAEQQKVSYHARNVARQSQQFQQWLQKRRQENSQRRAAGEEPLPEEDPVLFKPLPDPSQLDNYLIANQLQGYCEQVSQFSSLALERLTVVKALQDVPM